MIDWFDVLDGRNGFGLYSLLFSMLLGGSIGLPIPEDVPLVIGGVLLHQDKADLRILFPVLYVGIILGDIIVYGLGRWLGPKLFNMWPFKRVISEERATKLNNKLNKHGIWVIFLARHLFYVRTATFLSCGLFRMSFSRFIICDMFAALVSCSIMLAFGYFISDNISFITGLTNKSKPIPLLIFIVVCLFIARFFRKKREEGLNLD